MLLSAWLACAAPPLDVDRAAPFATELATFAESRVGPAHYADPRSSRRFSPDGVLGLWDRWRARVTARNAATTGDGT